MQITRRSWRGDLHAANNGGPEAHVNVTPEDTDDIWALYNIISEGDEVEMMTLRKVLKESSSGDVVASQKMKMVLAIIVEKSCIDLEAGCLRLTGRNCKENAHVKLGAYHTVEVEVDRWCKIRKRHWDCLAIEVLSQAIESIGKVEVGAILIDDGGCGAASISMVTPPSQVRVLESVAASLPKNRRFGPTSALEKATERFIEATVEAALRHVRWAQLKAILIGGTSDALLAAFVKRLLEVAAERPVKGVLENKAKFVRVRCTSGDPSAIPPLLAEARIAAILRDTKEAAQKKAIEAYYKAASLDGERVTFGPEHVLAAADQCAISKLLISDTLFRSTNVDDRRRYARIVETASENGAAIVIFTAGTEAEAELAKLSGIAATLNFSIGAD